MTQAKTTGSTERRENEKRFLSYHLNVDIVAPETKEQQNALADCVRKRLNLDYITSAGMEIDDGVWVFNFLHGAEHTQRVATYTDAPGMLDFPPQKSTAFVFDQPRKILYFTSGRRNAAELLLPALPGVILPSGAAVPTPYCLDLGQMDTFCAFYHRPPISSAPWHHFKLKEACYQKPGFYLKRQTLHEDDLLETPGFFECHRDERLHRALFSVYLCDNPQRWHRLEVRNNSNVLYAKIRPDTLPSIGAFLNFLDAPITPPTAGDLTHE